jgi:hypothetical protein
LKDDVYFPTTVEVSQHRFTFKENLKRTDFLKRLLSKPIKERLGCGSLGNSEVRSHSWFTGINWDALNRKEMKPNYVPDVNVF